MIHARGLSKQFRNYIKQPGIRGSLRSFWKREYRLIDAVRDFSIDIEEGEIIGLLGPNGAGKTTLMKMFTGIVAPSGGELEVLGNTPFDRSMDFRKQIALVMGQKSQLWWDIPAMDSFQLLGSYYEIEAQELQKRIAELAGLLHVEHLLNIHVRKLSLGERMKMELMACLLHRPSVIFLDEPTIGLDVVAQQNIRDFLREYQRQHRSTLLLTSHYMADVAALCERIVLILDGRKRFDGGIGDFERILGREKFVSIRFHEAVDKGNRLWEPLFPEWGDDGRRVELRIPEESFSKTSTEIFSSFPVADYSAEKLPIERVMQTLLKSPDLIDGESNS